ncbi:MAG: flagellar brake protein [Gammaproteobacteria bacterium]|nr:MAG: flagellar brake protein [Pseudomonadota bacterium]PIE39079.1 MAG: flagellar brake protein [Gammaproteobacteria bacterium]
MRARPTGSRENNQPQRRDDEPGISVEGLGLAIGDALVIETISPKRKLNARLIGYLAGHSVVITSPTKEGKDVALEQDVQLTVRGFVRKQAYAFTTRVIYKSRQPYFYYHLEYPRDMVAVEVRKTARVHVNLPVLVDTEFDIGIGDWPKTAVIQDLSTRGAGLLTDQDLGHKGHELILKLDIDISDIRKKIELPCAIRNRLVVDRGPGAKYLYGVELENLSDDDHLTLSGFLYELENDH